MKRLLVFLGWTLAIGVGGLGTLICSPLALFPFAVLIVWLFLTHRRRWGLIALACTPLALPVMGFAVGVTTYAAGVARIMAVGFPSFEFYNLDRGARCPWSTSGCVVIGYEPLIQIPNNVAIHALSRVLGPMPGAYTGPYPTKEEAFAAYRAATTRATRAELASGHLRVNGREIVMSSDLARDLNGVFNGRDSDLTVAPLSDDAFLVGGAHRKDWYGPHREWHGAEVTAIVLVDLARQRWIARYLYG